MNIITRRVSSVSCIIQCTLVMVIILFAAPSWAMLTIEEERALGDEFYKKLADRNILVKNQEINGYISELGTRILSQSEQSPFSFTFSVVNDSGINAFATPGGYVYVYSGLIRNTENESQLAGVLAHEIAHVKARHIAKLMEKQTKLGIAALAGMLAGAFLGGKEGGAAIASLSMATAASLSLKYSRENEEEADLLGMNYLVRAGYDGHGMLDFLKIMRQYEFYSNIVPSYFLTHPGTGDRIRYLDGLLETTYRKSTGKETILVRFPRVKTILIIDEDNPESQIKYFRERLAQNPGDVEGIYGLAMVHQKLGNMEDAFGNFEHALALAPDDPDILRDLGINYFNTGRTEAAIEKLGKAHALNRDDRDTILYLGKSYDAAGEFAKALTFFNDYRLKDPDDAAIYYNLAMAYGRIGDSGRSHYNFGIFFKKSVKPRSALFHFKAALEAFPPGSEEASRVKSEIDSLSAQ